jgi:hypothetical protein
VRLAILAGEAVPSCKENDLRHLYLDVNEVAALLGISRQTLNGKREPQPTGGPNNEARSTLFASEH